MQKKKTAYVSPNIAGILSLFDPALDWSADLSGDEYATALKEFLVVHQEGSKDPRKDDEIESDVMMGIRKEFLKVRKNKDLEYSVKKTKIKGNKFFDKDQGKGKTTDKSQNPDISRIFNSNDVKPADIDPESKQDESSALIPKRLDGIANSVESIATLLRRQLGLQQKQQRDAQVEQDKINKEDREDKLEKKPDKKTGGLPKVIAKPAIGFFEKIKKFFLNIVIGAAVYKMLDWFKDPANAEKITQFKDFLVNNAGLILGSLAALALLPVAIGLASVVQGVMAGLALLGPLLPALPVLLLGILTGAVAWWIHQKVSKALVGGKVIAEERHKNLQRLQAQGIEKSGIVLDPDTKEEIKVKRWQGSTGASGDDKYGSIEGRPWGPGDKGRNETVTINLNNAESQEWYGKFYGEEKLEEKLAALHLFKKTRSSFVQLNKDRQAEIKEMKESTPKTGFSSSGLGVPEHTKEEKALIAKKEEEINKKYDTKARELGKTSSVIDGPKKPAGISWEEWDKMSETDKNDAWKESGFNKLLPEATIDQVKPDTKVPGPSNKDTRGKTKVISGEGQTQSNGVEGGGNSQSSTTVSRFSSVDSNNLGIFPTQGMYNMVG